MAILEQLFTWTLRASWHASILVVVVILIQKLFRKQLTATWRHALWFAVLIRLATPFMPSSPLSALNLAPNTPPIKLSKSYARLPVQPSFSQKTTTSTFITNSQDLSPNPEPPQRVPPTPNPSHPSAYSDLSIFEVLSITWLSIAILLLIRVTVQNRRFAKGLSQHSATQLSRLDLPLQKAKRTLGLNQCQLQLLISQQVKSPCIFGLNRPTLVIPSGLDKGLSATELECVFLHELAHLKRHDILFSWIMCLLKCLHWFNPIVWFAMNRISADRELATDATVLKHANEDQSHCYGELILKLLEQWRRPATRPAGVVGIVESKRSLSNRIRAIARYSSSHRTPALGIAIATGLILMFMLEAAPPSTPQIEETTSITVTVMADQSDTPIANSRVEVRSYLWNSETKRWDVEIQAAKSAVSNGQGQAMIDGILSHVGRYKISASHPDHLPHLIIIDTSLAPLPAEADIYLLKAKTIGGFVTDPSGQPIQNVAIEISYPRPEIKVSSESSNSKPRTDQNGYWSFEGVSEDVHEVFIHFHHPQYALPPTLVTNGTGRSIRYIRYKQTSMDHLRNRDDHTILNRGTQFQGRVLDAMGEPIANAKIRIYGNHKGKPIETNEDGLFISNDTFVGELKGTITASGQAPEIFVVQVGKDSGSRDFRLSTGQQVHLKFVTPKGTPLEGVRILPQVSMGEPITPLAQDGKSDKQGLYQWNEAPKEPVTFSIRKEDYYRLKVTAIPSREETTVITMYKKPTVILEVKDQNGQPIPAFSVQQGRPNEFLNSWSKRDSWTGSKGRITIGDYLPQWIDPGFIPSYIYRVDAKGFHSQTTRIVTAEEENVILQLQLKPAPEYRRRLELQSGEALPGKRLYLLAPNNGYSVSEDSLALEAGNDEPILTDQNGEFETPNRNKEHFLLGLLPEGFFLESVDNRSTYKLTPWGSLRGTWREDGQPIEGLEIGFTLRQRAGENSPHLQFVKRVTTDRNGEFVFNKVPARKIDLLHVVSSGGNKDTDSYMAPFGGTTSFRFEKSVEINTGQETFVNLDHPTLRTIRGEIEFPEELRSNIERGSLPGMLEKDGLKLPIPATFQDKPMEMREWYIQWTKTVEGQQYLDNRRISTCLNLEENGTFSTHSIAPGKYRLSFTFREKTPSFRAPRPSSTIAQVMHYFEVTASSPKEIDLGTLKAVKPIQAVQGQLP